MSSQIEYKWRAFHWSETSETTTAMTQATNELVDEGWDIVDWKLENLTSSGGGGSFWVLVLLSRDKSVWAERQLNGDES